MKKTARNFSIAALSLALIFSTATATAAGWEDLMNLGNEISSMDADTDFTDEEIYYIGRSVAANILKKYEVYEDPEMESYLNKICQTLVINSSEPLPYNGYHVKILDTDEINAFSTPGGHILLTRGIISCAETEDALAAIIAHEIAHVQLQHGIKSIQKYRKKQAAASKMNKMTSYLSDYRIPGMDGTLSDMQEKFSKLSDSLGEKFSSTMEVFSDMSDGLSEMFDITSLSTNLEKLNLDSLDLSKFSSMTTDGLNSLKEEVLDLCSFSGLIINNLYSEGYSKEDEFEADNRALSLMADAGYLSSEMVSMLKKMKTTGEFKTHPKPEERIKKVNKALKKIKVLDTTAYRKTRFAELTK